MTAIVVKEKPHFFRLQIDFPFDGDLGSSKYEICYRVCLVDENAPNTSLGLVEKQGIESIDITELLSRNPDLGEYFAEIQAEVVAYAHEKLVTKGVISE